MATKTHGTAARRVGTLLAISVIAFGAAFASIPTAALAQNVNPLPSGWPSGLPLIANMGSNTPLSEAERTAFKNVVQGSTLTATAKTELIAKIDKCAVAADCTSADHATLRAQYIGMAGAPASTTGSPPASTETESGPQDVSGQTASIDECPDLIRGFVSCVTGAMARIVASVLWAFATFLGWCLGLIGMFFNWVMLITVFQYSVYFGNSEGILLAWSILRDIGNILLLFGFIFIGLQTILNIGHFSVGKALPRLIIFAILINFSLFVSEAIVDVSNVLSSSFYTYAGQVDCTNVANSKDCANDGIAGRILQASGLTGVFNIGALGDIWTESTGIQMLITYAGLCIFLIIMMTALGAAAIMFVIRAITLIVLLVLSPLGFAGMAIPQFEEQSSKWWSMLINQAFFAPIYLLMIFVGLKIMEGATAAFNPGSKSLIDAIAKTDVTAGGIFIIFALTIGFMIAAMTSAKSMGAMGASFAINQSGKLVGGVAFGVPSSLARRSLGVMGGAAAKGISANRAGIRKLIGPNNARALYGAAKGLTGASFDPRTTGLGKTAAKAAKVDLGSGQKGGIHHIEEKAEKSRKDFAKSLELNKEQQEKLDTVKAELELQTGRHAKERNTLNEQQNAALGPLEEAVAEQRRRVAAANTPEAKVREEAELGNRLRARNEARNEFTEAKAAQAATHKAEKEELEKSKKTAENAAVKEYIEDLEKKRFYPPLSIGTHVDHTVAKALVKDLDKDENAKIRDSIEALRKEMKGGKGHGDSGHDDADHKDDAHGHAR